MIDSKINMNSKSIDELATMLWNYNYIQQPLKKADCIVVLGNFDIRTAQHAARLFLDGYAPLMICTGNKSDSNRNLWGIPEAEVFFNEAVSLGIPKDKILLEKRATNTGENILFTRQLIKEKGLDIKSLIAVQKPFMLRRVYATFRKQWPEVEVIMSAPQFTFEEYPNKILSKDYIINIMVGDTQRIKLYPKMGFQIEQEMPDDIWAAWEELVIRGFSKHILKEDRHI